MSDAILNIAVNAKGMPEANDGLDKLDKNALKAEKSAKGLTGTVGLLSSALGALGISLGLMAVKNAADDWSDMSSRLGLAVGGADKATAVMSRLQDVAKNTYSDINTTTESFIANASVLRDLGKSTSQALDYTEALNNALVVSGAKADTAASVQEALSRAMALGKLSGENLNTVIAKGGEVASVIAKEMGVSTLQLRKLGEQGKITGDVLYSSLTNRLEELRDKAGEMPATMQDAATAWGNAFTVIIGTVDAATGASGALGQALYDLGYQVADQAGNIAAAFVSMQMLAGEVFEALSSAFGSMFGDFDTGSALMIAGISLGTTALVGLAATIMGPVLGALAAMGAAVLANPLGLLIGAIAGVVAAAFIFRDEIAQILGFDLIEAAKTGANYLIAAFVGTYNAVKAVWDDLPAAFEYIWKSGVNKVLDVMIWWAGKMEEFFDAIPGALGDALENFPTIFANGVRAGVKLGVDAISWMINTAIKLLNDMLSGVRWLFDKVGIEMKEIGRVDIGAGIADLPKTASKAYGALKGVLTDMKLDMSDSAKDAGSKIKSAYTEAFSTDYLGDFNNKLGETWTKASEVTKQFNDMNSALNGDAGEGVGGALGEAGGKGKKGKDEKSRAVERLKREMEQRLEVLTESHRAEEDLMAEKYLRDMETLNWARENEKLSQDEYNAYKLGVEARFQADLQALKMQEFSSALSATGDFFGAMSALQSGGNEKMLKAQKVFASASALVNAYLAATQALATPGIGPWGQLAAYASVLAAGLGAVAAIKGGGKSSSGHSGSGAPAMGNTQPAAPPEQKPINTQAVEIKLQGEVYSREAVAELMNKMNDLSSDGFKLIIGTS